MKCLSQLWTMLSVGRIFCGGTAFLAFGHAINLWISDYRTWAFVLSI